MKSNVIILGQSVALSSGQGSGEPPEWFLVLPSGQVRIEDGAPALMDEEAAQLVLSRFNDISHDMVIDYEHQTMGTGVAPAAGWIKQLEWRTDGPQPGLWAKAEWTPKAAEYLRQREYRYHSPVLLRRESDGRIIRLHNVALTNQPRMLDAPALVAKYTLNLHEGDENMSKLEALKKKLGLDAALTPEQVEVAALKAIADLEADKTKAEGEVVALKKTNPGSGTELVACKDVLTALGLSEGADKAKVIGAVEALKAPANAAGELVVTVEKLRTELGTMKADGLIQLALKDGKTCPAELDAWGRKMATEQPELFQTVVLGRAAGAVVPLKSTTPAADSAQGGVLTDDQRKINEMLGVSEESWKQHNPAAAK